MKKKTKRRVLTGVILVFFALMAFLPFIASTLPQTMPEEIVIENTDVSTSTNSSIQTSQISEKIEDVNASVLSEN